MTIASRLVSGLGWSALSQCVRIFLQLISIPILARLLDPKDFGIYAMSIPVLGLAGLLQDFGLQQALVQKDNLSAKQLTAVFWINFLISFCVAASMFLFSGTIAFFFSEPDLENLIKAFSAVTFLGAIGFGQYALLNRELRFKVLALIDMTCAIVSFIVVIFCAVNLRSFWALWAGALSSVMTWLLLSYMVASWRPGIPRFGINLDGMFRFGSHVMIHNFALYFSRNFDSILIGKFFGSMALGFYDRAYKILLFPIDNLAQPISRVMVPMLSRTRGDPDQYGKIFVLMNSLFHLACLPLLAALVGCSDQFILVLLGQNFSGVAPIFFWLGIAGFVQPLMIASHWALLSQGRSQTLMRISLASAFIISLCFVVGLNWGVVGVAAAYAVGEVFLRTPFMLWMIGRTGIIRYAIFLRNISAIGFSAIVSVLFSYVSALFVSGMMLVLLNVFFAYIFAAFCLALFPHGRELFREIRRVNAFFKGNYGPKSDSFNIHP
jgi:PST family polysaccharide transporter